MHSQQLFFHYASLKKVYKTISGVAAVKCTQWNPSYNTKLTTPSPDNDCPAIMNFAHLWKSPLIKFFYNCLNISTELIFKV